MRCRTAAEPPSATVRRTAPFQSSRQRPLRPSFFRALPHAGTLPDGRATQTAACTLSRHRAAETCLRPPTGPTAQTAGRTRVLRFAARHPGPCGRASIRRSVPIPISGAHLHPVACAIRGHRCATSPRKRTTAPAPQPTAGSRRSQSSAQAVPAAQGRQNTSSPR